MWTFLEKLEKMARFRILRALASRCSVNGGPSGPAEHFSPESRHSC